MALSVNQLPFPPFKLIPLFNPIPTPASALEVPASVQKVAETRCKISKLQQQNTTSNANFQQLGTKWTKINQ